MRETVALLRQAEDQAIARTPIIIGGGTLTEQVSRYVGAVPATAGYQAGRLRVGANGQAKILRGLGRPAAGSL